MAAEQGLSVDEEGFRRLMTEQRDRAKADAKAKKGQHSDVAAYREVSDSIGQPVRVHRLLRGGLRGDRARHRGRDRAVAAAAGEGDEVELVLDRTPFYAEGGGQLADQGVIELGNGARIQVLDVQSPITGLVVHQVKVLSGEVTVGQPAQALVDIERRRSISRAHTATHMVHKAFREALGDTATQAGSENAPGRFRFDFSASGAVPAVGDGRRRGAGQRPGARRPGGRRRDHDAGRGASVRRDGAVRREVRRRGARDLGRRLGARALRRHPRRQLGSARRGQAAGRVLHRLRRTTRRGARRRGRLPVPGPRARARRAARGGAQGAPGGAARAGQRPRRAAAGGGEGDRAGPGAAAPRGGGRARPSRPRTSTGCRSSGTAPTAPRAGDVRKLALDIRGRLPKGRPGVVAIIGSANGKPAVVVAVNDEAGRGGCPRTRW